MYIRIFDSHSVYPRCTTPGFSSVLVVDGRRRENDSSVEHGRSVNQLVILSTVVLNFLPGIFSYPHSPTHSGHL